MVTMKWKKKTVSVLKNILKLSLRPKKWKPNVLTGTIWFLFSFLAPFWRNVVAIRRKNDNCVELNMCVCFHLHNASSWGAPELPQWGPRVCCGETLWGADERGSLGDNYRRAHFRPGFCWIVLQRFHVSSMSSRDTRGWIIIPLWECDLWISVTMHSLPVLWQTASFRRLWLACWCGDAHGSLLGEAESSATLTEFESVLQLFYLHYFTKTTNGI